ncbi:hypothetical protein GCM10008955_24680 [Deinococcus malanensis]|uniref:DUF2384 domain-containing protein n=1 Tax=Deinococcus malanensis TaxID=1706855 RepID=A0ABQ2EXY6_9DEIO|nr:hypothetical protein [Deinococcus malanensis]GGK29969.1 hypothetical protein GCM10008955_24680 [Deinococcus malanensis]
MRLSLMVGTIYALLVLYSDYATSTWFARPNGRPPFDGCVPLEHLLSGGLRELSGIRRLLATDRSRQFSATLEARHHPGLLPQPPIDLDGPN